jgi:hypothetical protein
MDTFEKFIFAFMIGIVLAMVVYTSYVFTLDLQGIIFDILTNSR